MRIDALLFLIINRIHKYVDTLCFIIDRSFDNVQYSYLLHVLSKRMCIYVCLVIRSSEVRMFSSSSSSSASSIVISFEVKQKKERELVIPLKRIEN